MVVCEDDEFYIKLIKTLIPKYPDLKEKLEKEYPHILDDIYDRSPSNLNTMSFKEKSLAIIAELKQCLTWIKYFRKPVDEERDQAPDYYKTIDNPMDLQTLTQKIKNNEIKTAKEFCSKMMLIWKNAQKYNPPGNKVYKVSRKCHVESKRLITKYFPELFASGSQSPCHEQLAIPVYKEKRDKYDNLNKVRSHLACKICTKPMEFMIGFHEGCVYPFAKWDGELHCSSCGMILSDAKTGYYHCVKGCMESNKASTDDNDTSDTSSNTISHDPQIYLCEMCAGQKYDSNQIPSGWIATDLPFYGLWIDIEQDWYEAIIVLQDSNRVYYKMAFSSSTAHIDIDSFSNIEATITHYSQQMATIKCMVDTQNASPWDTLLLNINESTLKFIDTKKKEPDTIWNKVTQRCPHCNVDMILLLKDRIKTPNEFEERYCDIHKQYYAAQAKLNESERCVSFKAFEYGKKDRRYIHHKAFYYTCPSCNNHDICAGCTLIKTELEFKKKQLKIEKNMDNINDNDDNDDNEPPSKRQKISATESISASSTNNSSRDIAISNNNLRNHSYTIHSIKKKKKSERKRKRKRKRNELDESMQNDMQQMQINNDNINHKELYLKQKEKVNEIASELEECRKERDHWQLKYERLYNKVKSVLENDRSSSPPPLRKGK